MIDYNLLLRVLQQHTTFILTTHVNPDADAVGSVLAMHRFLTKLGKEVRVIIYSRMPDFLRFLDEDNVIEQYSHESHFDPITRADALIALDFNRFDRISVMSEVIPAMSGVKICIDHHQDPEQSFDYIFSDTMLCATGHIMFNFLEHTALFPIDKSFAEPLYAAIMTDTGSFRFERTTPEVHRIAARLLEAGVVPNHTHMMIYDQNHLGKLHLLGNALINIQLRGDKSDLGIMILRQSDFQSTGTREDDTEGFINQMMSIESVRVGLKFIELPNGFKVSLRSKGTIPVNILAGKFGGGGHINASGIRFRQNQLDEKFDEIVTAALQFLQEYNNEQFV
ncbi:MAG: DHH family phosphoesterase [Ignavibacteria bacterium]|nr:DHH family phosphoesterase [Ignavibacteria bacterium]